MCLDQRDRPYCYYYVIAIHAAIYRVDITRGTTRLVEFAVFPDGPRRTLWIVKEWAKDPVKRTRPLRAPRVRSAGSHHCCRLLLLAIFFLLYIMVHCKLESGDSTFSQYFQINRSLRVVCAIPRDDDSHLFTHAVTHTFVVEFFNYFRYVRWLGEIENFPLLMTILVRTRTVFISKPYHDIRAFFKQFSAAKKIQEFSLVFTPLLLYNN